MDNKLWFLGSVFNFMLQVTGECEGDFENV